MQAGQAASAGVFSAVLAQTGFTGACTHLCPTAHLVTFRVTSKRYSGVRLTPPKREACAAMY
jgi:2-methylcitrate dehydratase PrpD